MRTAHGSEPLHPTVKATGWVSFFTDMSSELIYAIVPFLLADSIKASRAFLGLIEGLLVLPASLLCGALWDWTGTAAWSLALGGAFALAAACVLLVLVPAQSAPGDAEANKWIARERRPEYPLLTI